MRYAHVPYPPPSECAEHLWYHDGSNPAVIVCNSIEELPIMQPVRFSKHSDSTYAIQIHPSSMINHVRQLSVQSAGNENVWRHVYHGHVRVGVVQMYNIGGCILL